MVIQVVATGAFVLVLTLYTALICQQCVLVVPELVQCDWPCKSQAVSMIALEKQQKPADL
jgi:hypothetical protein